MSEKSSIQILVAGPAGSGNLTTGIVLARALHKLGYDVIGVSEYPSLIRGGHTVYWVKASTDKVYELSRHSDYVITFDEITFTRNIDDFRNDTIVVFDNEVVNAKNARFGAPYVVPFRKLLKEHGLKPITTNMMAAGVLAGLMGIPLEELLWSITYQFKKRKELVEENTRSATIGYEYVSKNPPSMEVFRLKKPLARNGRRILLTGNEAIGAGFVKSDLRVYVAYPMTPASPILHFMVNVMNDKDIVVIQAESEIAAAQMALAATWTGVRAATATSGGGFALMNETLSEAGMFELPLVIVLAMRPGPSTGLATHSAQEELLYSIFAGHGEFPRIVVAPADQEDAYYRTIEVFNLAWKYRVPAIILEDKHLAESIRSVKAFEEDVKLDYGALVPKDRAEEMIKEGKVLKPYMDTENGVPPWIMPGSHGVFVKSDSSEHDEDGIVTEDPKIVSKQYSRRMRKEEYLRRDLEENYEVFRIYGENPEDSDMIVLTWGSAAWPSIESWRILREKNIRISIVQMIYLWPFPRQRFSEVLRRITGKPTVTVEYNYRGQLGILIRQETGFKPDAHIGKYDGRPFRSEDLAHRLEEFFGSFKNKK